MGMEGKFKSKFLMILALITILTLLFGALADWGIINLNTYLAGAIAVLLGFGMMLEGNIRTVMSMLKKGLKIKFPEFVHITTAIFGLIVFVAGVLSLIGIYLPAQALGIVGTVKMIAIMPIIGEYFV